MQACCRLDATPGRDLRPSPHHKHEEALSYRTWGQSIRNQGCRIISLMVALSLGSARSILDSSCRHPVDKPFSFMQLCQSTCRAMRAVAVSNSEALTAAR